ncbi:MmgE/PrpD family protein [Arthrobacter bambusae]|uniref:MmgE/PrpD family protein n=1 Tax=Arthrobacter bambusae TaxID=1338426 RepID=UPI002788E31E|nr:MmgE/PrpD family protein [Arthrobacter bambusae]MDQ0029051.1 2-methylcitrate dehydratase PrpD [Arthrobacter bambusae]MDQ0098547.1 2-methylcitrate dehydratase PrpD [Arthrobacter bambusae]
MNDGTELSDAANVGMRFAELAAKVEFDHLPGKAVEAAKKTLLDSLGVMLAASGTEPSVRPVVDLVREGAGREEASVLGFGFKVPATSAAFANGAMSHSLNYDDYLPWGQHCSLSLVPTVLAVTEYKQGVSGKDLIAAVAVGQDIFTRLRCNVDWKKDWNVSTVLGVFEAAGRVLGLSAHQINQAFAIASGEASGVMDVVSGAGSELGAIYGAFPARGATTAALLAAKGVVGVDTVFESKTGVFDTYFNGEYDRAAMLADLGVDYQGSTTLYKPWPAIGTAHSHIHATIGLVTDHELDVADIAELRVFVGDAHEILCVPPEIRKAPSTLLEARFGLPFLVALAAAKRSLSATALTIEALNDPQVLDLARKVVAIRDPDLDWKFELPNGIVEIVMGDGRKYVRVGENTPGSADAPMTWNELGQKFKECAAAAAIPVPGEGARRAQDLIANLELIDDAADVLESVSGEL